MLWALAINIISMDTPGPLTSQQCAQGIKDCNSHEYLLDIVPGAFTPYADCLKSNISVGDGCARPLNAFIKVWNHFVDECELCASAASPLVTYCADTDQNMVCPQRMELLPVPGNEPNDILPEAGVSPHLPTGHPLQNIVV